MKSIKSQSGQSLIEYLILVALIAVGSIAIVKSLSQTVYVKFANITNALQHKSNNMEADSVTEDQYKKRNLDDFFKSAQ